MLDEINQKGFEVNDIEEDDGLIRFRDDVIEKARYNLSARKEASEYKEETLNVTLFPESVLGNS